MNSNSEIKRASRSFENMRRASLVDKMETRRSSGSGWTFFLISNFLRNFLLSLTIFKKSLTSVYFSMHFPKWPHKVLACLIINLSAISACIPMYQSGLLFTKIEFTCANSTDYCDCNSTSYTHPFWSGNLITEFNLYCDQAYLVGVSDLCFFGGALFSGTFGFFLDKFSRKWTWLICSLLTTLLTGLQATSSSIVIYSVYRFLQGLFDRLFYQGMVLMFFLCAAW